MDWKKRIMSLLMEITFYTHQFFYWNDFGSPGSLLLFWEQLENATKVHDQWSTL